MGSVVAYQIIFGITRFLDILEILLVIYQLMTWFVRPDSPIYRFLARFLDPILTPFRRVGRRLIMSGLRIDISVLLAIVVLRVVQALLWRIYYLF